MIVSTIGPTGSKTVERNGHVCTARKNGSFVDVWIERNGERFFIAIPRRDLTRMAAIRGHDSSIDVCVTYDEIVGAK